MNLVTKLSNEEIRYCLRTILTILDSVLIEEKSPMDTKLKQQSLKSAKLIVGLLNEIDLKGHNENI